MQQPKLWGNSLKTWRSCRVLRAHHFGEGNTKSQGSHWRRLTFFVAAALLSSLTARRMEENKPLRNICVGQRNRQPVTPLFFGAETLAKLAGLTHDLGKYSLEFQERLQGKAQTVDHSTAGMAECCKQGAISAALAVAGHHAAPPSAENSTIWPRVSSSSTRHRCCLYPIYGPVCGLFLSW